MLIKYVLNSEHSTYMRGKSLTCDNIIRRPDKFIYEIKLGIHTSSHAIRAHL